MKHARAAKGCLDWTLSADLLDPSRANVYEAWSSSEALDAYRASDGPSRHQELNECSMSRSADRLRSIR
jgi:quinol monooxygenase YgiN